MLTTELMNVEQRYYSQNIFLRILNVVNLESICYFNVMIIAVPIISFNKMLLKMTMLFFVILSLTIELMDNFAKMDRRVKRYFTLHN